MTLERAEAEEPPLAWMGEGWGEGDLPLPTIHYPGGS